MFFLKHATESSFLISIGVLFHSLVAETAKERPPSVSLASFEFKTLTIVTQKCTSRGYIVLSKQ